MSKGTVTAAILLLGAGTAQMGRADSWVDKVELSGDLRYRHESIDAEGKAFRTRHRLRVRLNLAADLAEELSVDVRLASGSDDPASRNQTLDDSFTGKRINLDRAYFDWHPAALPGIHVVGGKIPMPWTLVGNLVWDGDVTPEGGALTYEVERDGTTFFLSAGGLWLEERTDDDDTLLFADQFGLDMPAGPARILAGISVYSYVNMEGYATLYDSEDAMGNSATEGEFGERVYSTEFNLVESFLAVSGRAGTLPVKAYADYVVNTEAEENNVGFMVGATVGEAREPGSIELDYNYRELEADAVVGALTDSSPLGGGTDGRGHSVSGKLQIMAGWQCEAVYMLSELGLDGASTDYSRFQLNLVAKF